MRPCNRHQAVFLIGRGMRVVWCTLSTCTLVNVTILHCAGSTEEPHRIRESGENNKSVVFKATVSYLFYSREIYTCTFSRYQVVQGSLDIVWTLMN